MKLKKLHGNVKAAGILFCVTGVTVLAFYQGPMLGSFNHHHLFQQANSSDDPEGNAHSKTQWVLGIFLITLSNVLAGLWTVLLGPLIEETSKLMNTALQISWAAVQAFVVAVAVERDFNKWKLGWDVELATGVVVTALSYYMQMWTITKGGRIFAGTLLIGGLYNVLWGKNIEEQDEVNDIVADKPEFEMQGKEAQMPGDAGTKV
ncbi:hypothetical protein OsJ_24518 [Oryza sativa Japonica Group]|nr:hypothetical protein OsJ_24518 [Oryza sativa Japonica Group]